MIIEPRPNIVQLKIDDVKAGVLDTSSKQTAVEFAEVLAVGEEINEICSSTRHTGAQCMELHGKIKIGDKVFVKAWAIDIVTHNDIKYYFCNLDTNGILAIVR